MTIMIILTSSIAIFIISISFLISNKSRYPVTLPNNGGINIDEESRSQYECGIEPFEEDLGKETRERYFLKFYRIGILFLIFDLETLLLYPATLLYSSPYYTWDPSYFVIILFLSILLLGLFYETRKAPF